MSKIVIELQQDCLNDQVPCSSLLRKAYAIAVKLGMQDVAEFCKLEMNGYKEVDRSRVPNFRQVIVNTEAYDACFCRWVPVSFPANSEFSKRYVVESIAEIEKIDQSKCDTLEYRLTADAQKIVYKVTNMDEQMNVHQILSASQITSIPQKVRNSLLEWSLKLEQEGVLGENLEFTSEERQKVMHSPSVYNITINGNVTNSNVSSMMNGSNASVGLK